MYAQEWALITFTVLTQMAAGAFLVLGVVHFYAVKKAGMEEADRLSDRALLAIVVVMVLALVASLFHLGNPINAPRAVGNLATSWLSREIFFGVIFTVLAVTFAVTQWRKIGPFSVRNVIAWITAIIGLVLIYCESRIYMIQAEPAWNTLATPISFFTTMLLLGSLAIGAALVANYAYVRKKDPTCADVQCELMRRALQLIALSSIILVGIDLIVVPVYIAYLATGSAAALSTAKLIIGPLSAVFVIRLILAFVGACIFGVFLFQNASSAGREKIMGYLAYSAFGLVLAAEVLGRYLFYATRVRIGI
jgi:anaerobic dimethyl sulfoxide reductase subunit C (anchor subunit)